MKQLKNHIKDVLILQNTIDWFITIAISKKGCIYKGVEFSFVNGEETRMAPFKINQGYLCLKNSVALYNYKKIISELTEEFKADINTLVNLFILINQTSYAGEEKAALVNEFKEQVGPQNCMNVYNKIIKSLNKEYYNHQNNTTKDPKTSEDWLELFQTAQYFQSISDPLINSLSLVKERGVSLDYFFIMDMNPFLRAMLIGMWGLELKIKNSVLFKIYSEERELIFLTACLLDNNDHAKTSPAWLTKKLVQISIHDHWNTSGKYLFLHTYGISYRNKNINANFNKIKRFIHSALYLKLTSSEGNFGEWIRKLTFPGDFIAFINWFVEKKILFSKISNPYREEITFHFIEELKRIAKELPKYLSSENHEDPFHSNELSDVKYQNTTAHLFLFLIFSKKESLNELRDVCQTFKPLFYGGSRAVSLATQFTELILLILLSGYKLKGLTEVSISNLKTACSIISDSILVPYAHLSERNDEIWDRDAEKSSFLMLNAGKLLINEGLLKIKKHEISDAYEEFFTGLESVKIAKWPYEVE